MKGADGTGWQHSQGKRLSAWPPPPTANACKVKIYKMKRYLLILPVLIMLFVACSHDDDGGVPSGENLETVKLYISVPGVQSTRMGDPGTAVPEGEDWDELAIMVEYTDTPTKRLLKTISKTDFEALPSLDAEGKIKIISLDVEEGEVYIYGVTYTSSALQSPKSVIGYWVNKSNGIEDISDLTISNAYAGGDMAKFVSVATGFYDLEDGNHTGERKIYSIKSITAPDFSNTIPTIILTRLAAKIDIQWDAADAYEAGYTDVKVKDFKYDSGNGIVDEGHGRLFPDLVSASASASAIGGSKEFYNTSEISQRNGRVYHYVFPDGVSVPKVTFNISAKKTGVTPDPSADYTLTFKSALQKATWYKVNAWIKGITGNGTIELDMSSTGS